MGRRVLTVVPAAAGDLYSISHPNAIDISLTEECYNLTNQTIGIANAWTISFWIKPATDTYTAALNVLQLQNSGNAQSRILFTVQGAVTNDPLRISITDTAAATIKSYDYDNAFATLSWRLYTLTWDGTSMKYYQDGTFITPTTLTTDTTGTMSDNTRRGSIMTGISGLANFSGILHSVAVWSTALTAANITSLYNGGSGYTYNVRNANNADLVTWQLFGYEGTTTFHNEVGTYNFGASASGLTSADIVADYPGI